MVTFRVDSVPFPVFLDKFGQFTRICRNFCNFAGSIRLSREWKENISFHVMCNSIQYSRTSKTEEKIVLLSKNRLVTYGTAARSKRKRKNYFQMKEPKEPRKMLESSKVKNLLNHQVKLKWTEERTKDRERFSWGGFFSFEF